MHKFNLEIEIPDKNYCNGCKHLKTGGYCKIYSMFTQYYTDHEVSLTGYTRPEICKQNDKEKTK